MDKEEEIPQAARTYFWLQFLQSEVGRNKAVGTSMQLSSRLGNRERTTPIFRLLIPTTAPRVAHS